MFHKTIAAKNYSWTPELAYATGLLVTDGNLSGDGRHLCLRSCDIEQIQNFKKCLGLENKIGFSAKGSTNSRICYRVQFSDVLLYRWLQKIGLFPAKTYTIGRLKIPKKFFRDFLRGHLDGDGTITFYRDNYNTYKNPQYSYLRLCVRFISASKVHLEWLQTMVSKLLAVKGDINKWRPPKDSFGRVCMWQLKFMKKDSQKLIPWLYYKDDLPTLTRKRQKAQSALASINSIQRKKYTFRREFAIVTKPATLLPWIFY